jgi:hypothetical protein
MLRLPRSISARSKALALTLAWAPMAWAGPDAPAPSASTLAPSALALPATPSLAPRTLRAMTRTPALRTRPGDPLSWASFEQCLELLERWAGRRIPDWVLHTATFSYQMRKPLYDPAGSPLLDADGHQRCDLVPGTGRVFFPPAWRLRGSPRLPLVIYTHATMMNRIDAPSAFGGHECLLAAAAAAYYGFAVAMPDQPGMGGDDQVYHTFCHAKSLAYSTLDSMPAVERLFAEDPYLTRHDYGWDGRLFVMGYSEGGYAALAAVKELSEHPVEYQGRFPLTAAACMAGPFDLSGTTRGIMIDRYRPFGHCFYLPFVIMAYQAVYGNLVDPREAFAPVLLETRADGDILQWADGTVSGLVVDNLIGNRLAVPGDAVVMRSVLNPAWTERELDDPAYATSTVHKLLKENDLCRSWRPDRPILFCQSPADQDVPIQNTLITLENLREEIRKVGGDPARLLAYLPLGAATGRINHVQGALLAIPAAFNWIYSGLPME